MDKLKPILDQKFWILAVLAILLPIYPWMTTLGTMQEEFKTKEGQIKDAFNKVPKEKSLANQKWIDPVVTQTKEEEKDFVKTKMLLWDSHKGLMKWPQGTLDIEKAMADNNVRFWGEIPVPVLRSYKQDFPVLKLDLYQKLKAFRPVVQATPSPGTPGAAAPRAGIAAAAPPATPATKPAEVKKGEELIAFPFEELPLRPLEKITVDLNSQQVWETQEDMWLLQSIFTALDNVNQDQPIPAQTQADAVIKQLYKVELMGGSKSRLAGPSGEAGGGTTPLAGGTPAGGGGPATPSAGTPIGGDKVAFSFNPSEEFGTLTGKADKSLATSAAGTPGAGALATAAAGAKPAGTTPPANPMPPAAAATPPKNSASMSVQASADRYIDKNQAALAQRTRGFYIELLMDHRKLPQLLTELRNSPWTTRVVRVQAVAKENGTAPAVQSYVYGQDPLTLNNTPAAPMFPGLGGITPPAEGIRFGRRNRDDDDSADSRDRSAPPPPQLIQPEAPPVVEAGPLGDPRLAYVAICGVITIYLPPAEAGNAIPAVATPVTSPAQPAPPPVGGIAPPSAPGAPLAVAPATPPAAPPAAAAKPATNAPPAAPPPATGTPPAAPAAASPPPAKK
ncbi:MAG: hypothetical protein U0903_21170 [Planctomycetales bacterium]